MSDDELGLVSMQRLLDEIGRRSLAMVVAICHSVDGEPDRCGYRYVCKGNQAACCGLSIMLGEYLKEDRADNEDLPEEFKE